MGKLKDKLKDSKLLAKVKQFAPQVLDVVGDVLPDKGGLGIVKNIIQKDDTISPENKVELLNAYQDDLKAFELEVQDRDSARKLYISDSLAQKILAVVFTVAYFAVSYGLLNHFFNDTEKLEDYELGFLSTLFGAMSSKVNTIIDFFFGGSMKK